MKEKEEEERIVVQCTDEGFEANVNDHINWLYDKIDRLKLQVQELSSGK